MGMDLFLRLSPFILCVTVRVEGSAFARIVFFVCRGLFWVLFLSITDNSFSVTKVEQRSTGDKIAQLWPELLIPQEEGASISHLQHH